MIPATAPRVPRAGFLPGSDIAAWLEEMARHAGMKFFIVPGSSEDLEPGGLLLMPATVSSAPAQFGPRVQPAAVEHGCVAVPLPMQLDPQLAPEEARRLLQYDYYFFHPSIGLIAFEESDAIQPEVLVVPPLPRSTSWMHAVHGRTPLPELLHITLALSEDVSGLFGEASEDIGSSDPKDLQRDSGKGAWVKDTLGNAIGTFGSWIMSGISKLGGGSDAGGDGKNADSSSGSGGKTGHEGKQRSPLWNKLQSWSAEQLAKLQRQREGAVQRLLNMLESDPDKGLRYALPLGGGERGRGIAPPSGRLSERNPTFGFGMRGGGGAADFWNVSADTQWKLRQKYLDLANRELAVGNFDRAAYIFAHLLGDWHAAAGALVRGKRFQEAAKIYEEKLQNKHLAAKCLEDGGLLAEAVLLYADLERHEKCGDLLRLLGREHDAVEAFRRALSGSSDRLHDARILYEKLNQPGLALAVLASGWPGSAQARACLETHFEYLHRLGAHDDALALAMRLDETRNHIHPPLEMARALHIIREKQTDPRVRERLSSVNITAIGYALRSCAPGDAHAFAEVLQKMEASDLLLRRDAIRYAESRFHEPRAVIKPQSSTKAPVSLTKVQQWSLPKDEDVEWHRFHTSGDSWLVRGAHRRSVQEFWMLGTRDTTVGKLTPCTSRHSTSHLQAHLLRGSTAWLPFSRGEQGTFYGCARLEDFRHPPTSPEPLISRLGWMPPAVIAMCPTPDGVWILHAREQGTIDLSHSTLEGKLRRTYALGISQGEMPEGVHMVTHGEHIWISAGSAMVYVAQGKIVAEMDLQAPIHRLVASPHTHTPGVLVSTSAEVKLITPRVVEEITLGSRGGNQNFGAFFGDGRILVGSERGAKILAGVADLKEIGSIDPLGLIVDYAPWSVDSMAVLDAGGMVRIYR